MAEKIAVCPGSFDPITLGHLDIIRRASGMFDQVIVLVSVNVKKSPTFTAEERVDFIRRSIVGLDNVQVDSFVGLLAEYAKEKRVTALVKGLRAVTDFENEFQMALINQKLCPEVNTVFLNTSAEYMYLSSTIVKQVAGFGGDISEFIPAPILVDVERRLKASPWDPGQTGKK